MMLGIVLAVWYTAPTHSPPTVRPNTTVRPKPATRATAVMAAMSAAARSNRRPASPAGRPVVTAGRRPPPGSCPPTKPVDRAQRSAAVDHRVETPPFRCQRQQAEDRGGCQWQVTGRQLHAEQRTQRVGSAVAQHGAF